MADRPPSETRQAIWTLNPDILLHILDLQVRFPHKPRLNTSALIVTRRCSQVCRQWRGLILSTPSLWAKLIDLSALLDTSDDWKHEILHRAGNVPLWVSVCVAEKQRGYPFFLWMLDKHWERIEILTLEFRMITYRDPDPRWSAMRRPSPLLRSINIDIMRVGVPDAMITQAFSPLQLTQPPVHLLDGGAPALRHLTASVVPPFNIHIQSPSLHSINLTLSRASKDLFPSLIAGLRTLTCLERLELYDNQERLITPPLPPASHRALLPRLALIKFEGPWSSFTLILGQKRPAPGCSVFIRTSALIQPQTLPAAENVINSYAQNFWGVHHSQYVEMGLNENNFKLHPWKGSLPKIRSNFHAIGSSYDYRIIYHQDVSPEFSIYLNPGRSFENAIRRSLFALSCVPRDIFSSVTHLHVSKFSLQSVDPDPVIQLIHALTCVEYLAVSLGFFQVIVTTLEGLISSNGAVSGHLPALKLLKMRYSDSLEAVDFASLVEYADLRRSAGLAQIYALDLEDMEAKVVIPLNKLLSRAAATVLYPAKKGDVFGR